mmetsp:Transcript_36094/g.103789  ORF Transcript_36094/g.103789 Transcript_36094/m.103789 type:complete len:210 (+) Transcript_36094:525-1154(+)
MAVCTGPDTIPMAKIITQGNISKNTLVYDTTAKQAKAAQVRKYPSRTMNSSPYRFKNQGLRITTRDMMETTAKVMIKLMLAPFSTPNTILQYWKKTLCRRFKENWSRNVMAPKSSRNRVESRNCNAPTGFALRHTIGVRCSGLSDSCNQKPITNMLTRLSAEAANIGTPRPILDSKPPRGMPTRKELQMQAKSSAKFREPVSAVLTSPM